MMQIEEISRQNYDRYVETYLQSFFQRSYWGDIKKAAGEYATAYYEIKSNDKRVGAFQVLIKRVALFPVSFSYIPRGMFFYDVEMLSNPAFLTDLLHLLKKEFFFLIVEFDTPFPLEEEKSAQFAQYTSHVAKESDCLEITKEIQPRYTVVKKLTYIDLFQSIRSSNARRNIKRGLNFFEEQGFTFEAVEKLQDAELEKIVGLINTVASEKGFLTRSLEYLRILQKFAKTQWFIIRDGEKNIVLANIGLLEGETYYDLLIGKINEYDRQYISYVLKAKSFEYLKSKGIKYYDHGGAEIDESSPKHGFTVFKLHFGGELITYPKLIILSRVLPRFVLKILIRRL